MQQSESRGSVEPLSPKPGAAPGAPSPSGDGKPNGAPAGAAAAVPAAPAKRKPPVVLMAVLGVALLVGGVVGGKWWLHRQAYVSTDDAQVSGDIVQVSARVPGRLSEMLVDEGQNVKAGQVIARLDDVDFKAQLAQAQAALEVSRANLRSSEVGVSLTSNQTTAGIGQAQAQLRVAQAGVAAASANAEKARTDLSRLERIYKEGGASKQQYEAAATSAATAEAAVAQARSQVAAAEQGLASAQASTQNVQIKQGGVSTVQAQIKQAEAAMQSAQLQLSHTTISAPADGLVVRKIAHAGEQVSPGQAIYSVAETDNVWVTAYVEETNIRRVHQSAPVEIEIDAFPHRKFEGKVGFVNAVTGGQFSLLPANNASGNFTKVVQRIPVKILVNDPNHELKPGMSAVVDIDARQQ